MHYSFKSTPTYTMKGRPHSVNSHYPGPADYIVKKPLFRSGNVSAVSQKRNLYKPFEPNPGPGSYELKSYTDDGPKRTMSARHFSSVKRTPGPQQYDNDTLKVKSKAPGFSISTRSKSYHQLTMDNNVFTPGPTQYNHPGSFEKNNGIIIGTSNRKDLTQTQKTPGPNNYISQKAADYTSKVNPKCVFGSQNRKTTDFMTVQVTPSPDKYEKKTIFQNNKQKKVGFSCRKKNPDFLRMEMSKFPGPGQYESHLKNKSQAPRCAGTHTQRKTFIDDMQDFKKTFPGPGQHQQNFKISKYESTSVFNFGKSTRRPLDENQKTPGPAVYRNEKMQIMNSAPKFSVTKTIAKNQFLAVNPENPGPGTYNPSVQLVKQSCAQYEVGREKRPGFQKQKFLPGPGFYNLRGRSSSGPGWGFAKQKRPAFTDKMNEAKNGTQYNIPQKVVDPPKYMNVQSKVQYETPLKSAYSTFNTARKSPQKQTL